MAGNSAQWSDLPPQLWPAIGNRLDTYLDVVRFRSVCASWRAALPPFHSNSPLLPIPFPSPITAAARPTNALLFRSIIYRLSPLDHNHSSNSGAEGWLAKVETSEDGKMRLLHPLSRRHIKYNDDALPKEWNLLDFRINELAKSYTLQYETGTFVPRITKVVMFPDSDRLDVRDRTPMAVYEQGKLGFARFGDGKWTLIDDQNFHYEDVIVYRGQFYAVDRWGTIFWIDSSMRLVQFSPPLCGLGHQKHLMEFNGELCVIDRFLDEEGTLRNKDNHHFHSLNYPYGVLDNNSYPKVVDFRVYRLDQEWGRWVELRTLGNQAFILGNGCCFSVSASELEGFKGSCIYFTRVGDDATRGRRMSSCDGRVFDLGERRIWNIASMDDQTQPFRPPPTWLS